MAEDMADFLRWWKATLVSTLPTGLTNAYSTRRQSVYIYQKDDAWCAGIPSRPELGCISENRRLRRRVAASDPVLLLEPHEVLVRRRRMPVASLNRLAHAMRLQIPAETPFDLQEIYTATRIAGDPDTDGTVLVEQAIVKRDLADARLAEILALEIDLAGADILDEDGNPSGFNLLPPEKCARQGAFLPTVNRVFGFAALALTAALATSWYVDLSREAAQVEKAAAASGQIARQVLQLQASAQSDVATIQQIDAVISNPGRFAAAYAAVTEALGDDTWLEGFTYSGNTASLTGLTSKPDALISTLEASPKVYSARFTSSVITDRRYSAERFRLEVVFKAGGGGEAVASMGDRG